MFTEMNESCEGYSGFDFLLKIFADRIQVIIFLPNDPLHLPNAVWRENDICRVCEEPICGVNEQSSALYSPGERQNGLVQSEGEKFVVICMLFSVFVVY
jgi:hypothetical protein